MKSATHSILDSLGQDLGRLCGAGEAVLISLGVREELPDLYPATLICSFNLNAPKLTSVSSLQQGTLHKADYFRFSLPNQTVAFINPYNCQELCNAIIRFSKSQHLSGNEGRMGCVPWPFSCDTAIEDSFRSTYCANTVPDLSALGCRFGAASLL